MTGVASSLLKETVGVSSSLTLSLLCKANLTMKIILPMLSWKQVLENQALNS